MPSFNQELGLNQESIAVSANVTYNKYTGCVSGNTGLQIQDTELMLRYQINCNHSILSFLYRGHVG